MKATELMIGDWVRVTDKARETYCYGEYKAGEIVQVREILDYGINPDWCGAEVNDVLHLEAIEPIPLTKEILEANGFQLNQVREETPRYVWFGESTRNDTIVSVSFYTPPVHGVKVLTKIETDSSHGCGVNNVHNCDIEYVHELQHALRLCGIDKEIII